MSRRVGSPEGETRLTGAPDAAPTGAMNLPRTVVLVEGASDRVALHTLAGRLGRDLEVEGVRVVAMGGITNTRAFAARTASRRPACW